MFEQSRVFPISPIAPQGGRASTRLVAMAAEQSRARAGPSPRRGDGADEEPDAVEFLVEGGEGDGAPHAPLASGSGPPSRAGRLAEHWVPGGAGTVQRAVSAVHRRPVIVVVGVGLAVAVVTGISMLSAQPRPEAAPRLPAATAGPASAAAPNKVSTAVSAVAPAKLIVSVVGRVARPGLVTLPDGSRVADAVRAAGGAKAGTNVLALNLARRLADGEQIYVGIPVPPGASPAPAAAATGGGGGTPGDAGTGAKVDLNTATAAQLDALPGVGEVTAQNILDWRGQHGRFASVSQLNDVDGIGEVRYSKLKDLVEVR